MKVALYGIYGTYNFGCEAIVRGARQFVKAIYPNAKIKYFSYSYDYDRKALADLDIEVVPVKEERTLLKQCVNKGLSILGWERRLFYFNEKEMLSDIDIVLSIGGDIYTIPQVLREHPKYPYYNHLVDFCDRAIRCGKKVVVYGASVGPFGSYERAVDYYIRNLKKYNRILCRERETVRYLEDFGLMNAVFLPDPAFQVRIGTSDEIRRQYIGINFSPLSFCEIYGGNGYENAEHVASLIDLICEQFQMELLFVPHVLSKDRADNDLVFLQMVHQKMNKKYRPLVHFADASGGFLGIKRQLRTCRMVVSARMHCAINAVCESVPIIFLSYSQKSVGMCEYVYGNDFWSLPLKNMDTELIPKIERMLKKENQIREYLSQFNQQFYSGNLIDQIKDGGVT